MKTCANTLRSSGPVGISRLPARSGAVRVKAIAEPLRRSSGAQDPRDGLPFTANSDHLNSWTPQSWKNYQALQQPEYPSKDVLAQALNEISRMPPLVFAGECRTLQQRLAQAGVLLL